MRIALQKSDEEDALKLIVYDDVIHLHRALTVLPEDEKEALDQITCVFNKLIENYEDLRKII